MGLIPSQPGLREYLLVLTGIAVATVTAWYLHQYLAHANLSLVFLVAVVLTARWGHGPAIFASVVSFLVYNYLFTTPYNTFLVEEKHDFATLALFLLTALLSGQLAARMRGALLREHASLERISNLYAFNRRLAVSGSNSEILDALADHLAKTLNTRVMGCYGSGASIERFYAGYTLVHGGRPDPAQLACIQEARGDSGSWKVFSLKTATEERGKILVEADSLNADQRHLVTTLCDQATLALERNRLLQDLAKERLELEAERLRSALLSSVSHDLRTPLSSIIGAASSLLDYGEGIAAENRRELQLTIRDEAVRLNRYIQNLLDMTRLDRGATNLLRDWEDLHDIVAAALQRLTIELEGINVKIDIAPDAALLHVHGVFLEQALVNILDNAARFSPADGTLLLQSRREGERVFIDVVDEGPGIPEASREQIFDMFYSMKDGDRGVGTGLGLAISRGLIGAHGGEIQAQPGSGGRGTRMHISLPAPSLPTGQKSAAS